MIASRAIAASLAMTTSWAMIVAASLGTIASFAVMIQMVTSTALLDVVTAFPVLMGNDPTYAELAQVMDLARNRDSIATTATAGTVFAITMIILEVSTFGTVTDTVEIKQASEQAWVTALQVVLALGER